ncbi:MAG: four helix bundle protein [Sedimentisphaerales bacterium]|nr:four helix bundle protein [Sedimentisphaerales bacterium]
MRAQEHKSIWKGPEIDQVGYKKLIVWHKADDLAYQVYIATKDFPKEELYGITSQLRRAVLSVPTNIVEGYGRQGKNELRHFVNIALGSLAETKYLLDFSSKLNYLNTNQYKSLQELAQEVGKLLWKFYKSL